LKQDPLKIFTNEILKADPNWGQHNNWTWKNNSCHWRAIGEEDGSPLILVHGFGASSEHWRNNAAYFAEKGFRVYAIDLIGFGMSDQPSSKKFDYLDNAVWAQQVIAFSEEVVKASQFKKVSIIGNSLGGLVALTSLYFRPDLIKSIIASPLPDPCFTQKFIPSKSIWIKRVTKF